MLLMTAVVATGCRSGRRAALSFSSSMVLSVFPAIGQSEYAEDEPAMRLYHGT